MYVYPCVGLNLSLSFFFYLSFSLSFFLSLSLKVIDPLNYKPQLTMPKLVIDATGDEFFMPDDDYFWCVCSLSFSLCFVIDVTKESSSCFTTSDLPRPFRNLVGHLCVGGVSWKARHTV